MRPARALPYELQVQAQVPLGGGQVELTFENAGEGGAAFHVYDRLALAQVPRRYTVEAGNLVVNGDAEADVTGWTGYEGHNMFQSVDYGSNWVLSSQPGPVDRGSKMFAGFGQYAAAYLTLDFGLTTTRQTSYALSGWLGG